MKNKLRTYQKTFKKSTYEALLNNQSVMATLPTGGGKTVVFNSIIMSEISNTNGMVLVIAHRTELITQAYEKISHGTTDEVGIIRSGEKPNINGRIQVASIQTLSSWIRQLEKEPKTYFGKKAWKLSYEKWESWFRTLLEKITLVVIDEAHLAKAKTYIDVIERCAKAKVVGFTATPYRLSGEGFAPLFDTLVVGSNIRALEKEGYLMPAKIYLTPISGETLSKLKMANGDYKDKDLMELMTEGKVVSNAIQAYEKHGNEKRCIAFCVNVEHSQLIAEKYREAGISAIHIDGTSSDVVRKKALIDLKSGKLKVVCNVGVWTTGTDIPEVEVIQLLRPTKSLSMFLQMVGRGSRPCPEIDKKEFVLLDHANNVLEHGVPNKEHDWERHFRGWKRTKKERDLDEMNSLVIDIDTKKIYTAKQVPEGVQVQMLEINESARLQEIAEAVKEGRKRRLFNHTVALNFSIILQQKYGREESNPTYSEFLIISALTGGTKRQAQIWANKWDATYVHTYEPKPCPKAFSGIQKAKIKELVDKNCGEIFSLFSVEDAKNVSDGRDSTNEGMAAAYRKIVKVRKELMLDELINVGVYDSIV